MNFNLQPILNELQKAPHPVKLVAVTKSFEVETTKALIKAGASAIAENRVERAVEKLPQLPSVETHFIGQIQSKKIKSIVQLFDVIESVGSNQHLLKIDGLAQALNKKVDVFLQFNISEESQKSGYSIQDLEAVEKGMSQLQFIRVVGLMGMASNTSDASVIRSQFASLRHLRDELQKRHSTIRELSMGMSSDYRMAIEEGATVVRIGRALVNA